MRPIHRIVCFFVVIFTLYLGVTGTLIQLVDLRSIFTHASPLDPNVEAMHEAFNGGGDYEVLRGPEYLLQTFPAGSNLQAMATHTAQGARQQFPDGKFDYVELRMDQGHPVGQVQIDRKLYRYDVTTGAAQGLAPVIHYDSDSPESLRNDFKHLHRMTTFGNNALWINVFVSIGLAVLIFTGLWVYVQQWRGRAQLKKTGLFWKSGGWWRTLHRAISLVAAIFLTVVMASGAWLAYESLMMGFNMAAQSKAMSAPGAKTSPIFRRPAIVPVAEQNISNMVDATLAAYAGIEPDGTIRVLRLRNYGGYAQGVVITGDSEAQQLVFDTATGRKQSTTEPGYPKVGFPFGWQAHQTAKAIHRGSYFGLTGRMMDLLSGFAMIYLSISGIVMYVELWRKRARTGHKAWIWF